MKYFVLVVSSFLSLAASAVELHEATNSQLVAELERRLNTGGTGSPGAIGSYYCDSSARLYLELVGETGQSEKKDLYIGDARACEDYATELNANRSRIRAISLAAVCDSSARLYRYTLQANGKFGSTTDIYVGDSAKCRAQAKTINKSN